MSPGPVRILQVVGGMGMGGAETWLMHVTRRIDRDRFRMDFLVHGAEKRAYDDELAGLGCRILRCPLRYRPLSHARAFLRILKEAGPYDVVHSHLHYFSGLVLFLAKRGGVPSRIAHSHCDVRPDAREAGIHRAAYRKLMRTLISRSATQGLAVSHPAADDLFGPEWRKDPRFQVLHCGLDLSACAEPVDGATIRRELGLPEGALVVGHVGRFMPQKNHAQLLGIVAEMVRMDPRVHALLIGEGPLRGEVERQAAARGIRERIVFAGLRRDVPRLLRGAMDVLVFPSFFEGLPLTVVEAQAAGLPCLVSSAVSPEVAQSELVSWLPLAAPRAAWAALALRLARSAKSSPPSTAGWPSDLAASLRALEERYGSAVVQ